MNRKVTVVVPIYNVEKYIGKMLDSLTAQDYENFEALLIDRRLAAAGGAARLSLGGGWPPSAKIINVRAAVHL